MPNRNPRLLVTLDAILYQWIKQVAEAQGISMSLVLRDMVKKMYESEAWYWTEEWQKGEREAQEDIRLGRYKDFDTADEFFKELNS